MGANKKHRRTVIVKIWLHPPFVLYLKNKLCVFCKTIDNWTIFTEHKYYFVFFNLENNTSDILSVFRLWQSFSRRDEVWMCFAGRWWTWRWQSSNSRLSSTNIWALPRGDITLDRCLTRFAVFWSLTVTRCVVTGWRYNSFRLWDQQSERSCRSWNNSWKINFWI